MPPEVIQMEQPLELMQINQYVEEAGLGDDIGKKMQKDDKRKRQFPLSVFSRAQHGPGARLAPGSLSG
jgi:hypothetical protein